MTFEEHQVFGGGVNRYLVGKVPSVTAWHEFDETPKALRRCHGCFIYAVLRTIRALHAALIHYGPLDNILGASGI